MSDDNFLSRFAQIGVGVGALGAGWHLWNSDAKSKAIKTVNQNIADVSRSIDNAGHSNLRKVMAEAGRSFTEHQRSNVQRDAQISAEIQEALSRSDYVQKMSNTVEKTNALINSVLNTLDDPTTGLEDVLPSNFRHNLLAIAEELSASGSPEQIADDLKDVMKGFIHAVKGGPDKNRITFGRHLRESRGLAQDLAAPRSISAPSPDTGQSFASISSMRENDAFKSLNKSRQSQIERGMRRLRQKGWAGDAQIIRTTDDQWYARVFRPSSGDAEARSFLFPLSLSEKMAGSGGRISTTPDRIKMSSDMAYNWVLGRGGIDATALRRDLGRIGLGAHEIPSFLRGTHLRAMRHQGMTGKAFMQQFPKIGAQLTEAQWDAYISKARQLDFFPTISRAMVSNEELIQNVLLDNIDRERSIPSIRKAQQLARSLGMGGDAYATVEALAGEEATHAARALDMKQNMLKMHNLEKLSESERRELFQQMNAHRSFDPTGSPSTLLSRTKIDDTTVITADVGIRQGGAIDILRAPSAQVAEQGGIHMRAMVPKVSRLEQAIGRTAMFSASESTPVGNVILGAGPNIDFEGMTGTVNKAYVMVAGGNGASDSVKQLWESLSGTGQAFYAGEDTLTTTKTFRVSDPTGMSSKILNAAENNAILDLTLKDGAYYLGDERVGTYIGKDSTGAPVHLKTNPHSHRTRVSIQRLIDKDDQVSYKLVQRIERKQRGSKFFSTWFKGLTAPVSEQRLEEHVRRTGVGGRVLDELGLPINQLVLGAGDHFKKAPSFWELQLSSALELMGGSRADIVSDLRGKTFTSTDDYMTQFVRSFATRAQAAPKGTPQMIGAALAGIASETIGMPSVFKQAIAGSTLSQDQAFIDTVKQGVFFGAGSVSPGEGPGDWGKARGSLDKRSLSIFASRMSQMGLDKDTSASVINELISRSQGLEERVSIANTMLGLAQEVTGVKAADTTISAAALMNDINTMDTSFSELLAKRGSTGVDLVGDFDTAGARQLRAALEQELGATGLTLPGGERIDAFLNTIIRKGETNEASIVYSEMIQDLEDFVKFSSKVAQTDAELDPDELVKKIRTFKEQTLSKFADSQSEFFSGKLVGSSYVPMYSYDGTKISNPYGLDPVQRKLAESMDKLAGGRAIFFDDIAFLNNLGDFMSTSDLNDAAHKAERFFLGHLDSAGNITTPDKMRGIAGVSLRQPVMSFGHMTPVQYFRDVSMHGDTTVLEQFKRQAGNPVYDNINTWSDVARLGRGDRRDFFTNFIKTMRDFAGDHSGTAYTLRKQKEVSMEIAGKQTRIMMDFGLQQMAFGDNDGDHWLHMMFNKKNSQAIMNGMKESSFKELDIMFRKSALGYGEVAKQALKQMRARAGFMTTQAQIQQDVMKEAASKLDTGPLDIQLNRLRIAAAEHALGHGATGRGVVAAQLSGLFAALEEHTTIKSKKAPIYMPFSALLTDAVSHAMESGDTARLRSVISDELFGGISEFTVDGHRVSIQNTMLEIDDIVKTARSTSSGLDVSAGNIRRQMKKNARAITEQVEAGHGMAGAFIRGAQGHTVDSLAATANTVSRQVTEVARNMSMKSAGAVAVGLFGGSLLMGAFAPSYSSEPLTSAYDPISPQGQQALKERRPTQPNMETLDQPNNNYAAMLNRSFNERSTYVNKPNSFQIRGEIPPGVNVNSITRTLQTGGFSGAGTIQVQDNRRPITKNYLDRLTGAY